MPEVSVGCPGKEQEVLARCRRLAHILDEAFEIPGTRIRVGWDPFLGMFPGVGDLVGLILGFYLIYVALLMRVSKGVILRMLANLIIDWAVGLLPLFGDIFDVFWKANVRNLKLLEQAVGVAKEVREVGYR